MKLGGSPGPGREKISNEVKTMSENLLERIELNPQIIMGKPVIKGTRIPVEVILKKLAHKISRLRSSYGTIRV